MELNDRTLEVLSDSLNQLFQKGKKKEPRNLINLIKEIQGVINFDNNDHRYCCCLDVVTLTTIAVTLRNTKKVEVDRLLKGIREGLEYVTLVEKNLNATDDYYFRIQKAAETLWEEVDFRHEWLGIKLKDIASEVNAADGDEDTTMRIIEWFFKEAEKKSKEGAGSTDSGGPNGDFDFTSICARSMSRITEAIIDDHKESHKKSFDELISSRIADIIAACLINLPQVIAMKCHTCAIEKREASVQVAAQLLGETKKIIKILQDPSNHAPSTNPNYVLN